MKAILISIRPKWCELIANGKKTVEIRKTKPKIETPFKVYIYCTKGKPFMKTAGNSCFIDEEYRQGANLYGLYELINGKVIGEFVCKRITDIKPFGFDDIEGFEKKSCLKSADIVRYLKGFYGHGWHISDLVIYDKPKELSEFWSCKGRECSFCSDFKMAKDGLYDCFAKLTRPPQSWCYVEEMKGE